MPPVRHRNRLTDIEKGEIIVLSKHNSHAQIAKELNLPWRTISNFLQRYENRHSPYNLPHSGKPRKTSATFNRWLVRTVLMDTRLPFKELKSIANIPISERTIRRRLQEEGIRKWRGLK